MCGEKYKIKKKNKIGLIIKLLKGIYDILKRNEGRDLETFLRYYENNINNSGVLCRYNWEEAYVKAYDVYGFDRKHPFGQKVVHLMDYYIENEKKKLKEND